MTHQSAYDAATRSDRTGYSQPKRRILKRILLVVEVATVVGLLLSAAWFWQLRQHLLGELEVAQQIEAALQTSEQLSGSDESSTRTLISCQIIDATTAEADSQSPCRLEAPELGLDEVLLPGGEVEVLSARNIDAESSVFGISPESFAHLVKHVDRLHGSTIRLASGESAIIAKASLVQSSGRERSSVPAYLSLEPVYSQDAAGEIGEIIILPDHEDD